MPTDVWELEGDEPEWLETICIRLLEVGVPPTAIGKAFQVDPHVIKDLQDTLHVQQYGTPEISEAMMFLMWKAYQDALSILESAPSATRTRFIITLLSRQSVILGKESPQSLERMRNALNDLYAHIGIADPTTPSIYAASEFTPFNGSSNDSEEGLED